MGFIYKITNKINNKSYIGKTLLTPEKRFKEHISESKKDRCKNRPLYRAFNKYGIDNFSLKTIEECNNNILSDRESYWIKYYNTYKEGYNATLGGDGKQYIDESKVIKLYVVNLNITKTAKQLHISSDTVKQILKTNHISIRPSQVINKEKFLMLDNTSIYMFDRDNTYLQTFKNIQDAMNFIKIKHLCKNGTSDRRIRNCIKKVLDKNRKTAYGYIWKYDK